MKYFNATICGGSYDPVHEGHLWVVEELFKDIEETESGLVVIATTFQNPWKEKVQPANFELRLKMWEALLDGAGLPHSRIAQQGSIYLCNFHYVYAADFVSWWRENYRGLQTWVTSTDSSGQEKQWKNWTELGVEMKVMPMHREVHSTAIRSGSHPPVPAIRKIILENSIYPNSFWE